MAKGGITHWPHNAPFWRTKIDSCGKHCEKRRNCLLQPISPFPTTLSTLYGTSFSFHCKMWSVICFNLDQSKVLSSGNGLFLHHAIPTFHNLEKVAFENMVGKWENADNQHFPFSHNDCYSSQSKFQFLGHINLSSANALNLDKSIILLFSKDLIAFTPFQNNKF